MSLLSALPDRFRALSTSRGLACSEEIDLAELQRIMIPLQPKPAKQQQASAQAAAAAERGGRQQQQQAQQAPQQAPQQAQQQAPLGSPQQSALASHHTQLDGQPGAADDTAATAAAAATPSTVRERHANRLCGSPALAAAGKAGGGDAGGEESWMRAGAPAEGQQGASLAGTGAAGPESAGLASHPGKLAAPGKRSRQARVVDSESEREEELEQEDDGRCGWLSGFGGY